MLNASINIDAASLLTYNTDAAVAEHLNVSVSGNVYTFASDQNIDIASNVPGLIITNPGTPTVTVTGITGLTVDAGFTADSVSVLSSNVPTAINLTASDATVIVGDLGNSAGLGAISAPITVTGPAVTTLNSLSLVDSGSTANTSYTIKPTTVVADNGFGGLTYAGVSNLYVVEAQGTPGGSNIFSVRGTADGVATALDGTLNKAGNQFNVYQTGATGSLALWGGSGDSSFVVIQASVPVNVHGGAGQNRVDVGTTFVGTTGVASAVTLSTNTANPFDIDVDDNDGTTDDSWVLAAQATPSTLAQLTGLSAGGSLLYDPTQVKALTISTASGKTNRLTINVGNGYPLPSAGGAPTFTYHGGAEAGVSTSDLVLIGALPTGPVTSELHLVTGAGTGAVTFSNAASPIFYDGLSSHSIYDTVPVTNYIFNDTADADGRVLIKEGVNSALTGNVQSLLITSLGTPSSFADTYLANKTNITANVSNGASETETTVNYGIAAPVAGLSTLTVATNQGADAAKLVALPPGVTTNLKQLNGNDRAYLTLQGTANTPATNLDGGLGYDNLIIDAGGLPITPGNFAPGLGGSTVISGAPLPGGPITYVNYERLYVSNLAAVQPVVTASTIHAVQGQRLVDVVAGTFTSAAPGAKAGDFASTIHWGDGSASAGVIVQDASNPSIFYVMGTHTYYGDSFALTTQTSVTVVSAGSQTTTMINGVPVTFYTPGSDPVTANGIAVIDNASISLTVGSFSGFENITPNPLDVFTASFTDHGGVNPADANPAGHYSVVINWGDGSAPLPAPASSIVQNGTSNSYTVTVPQHVYSTPGSYVVTVTVSDDNPIPVITTATGVATIADAPLSPSDLILPIPPATEGVQITGQRLVEFFDANPKSHVGDFTVTIDWGDGSPMSYGSLIQPGGIGGTYFVVGTHTYTDALRAGAPPVAWGPGPIAGPLTAVGTYPIRIFVQDTYGSAVNLATTITVNDNPLTLGGKLNPLSDSGASNSDGITNVAQPNFQGSTSEGGALVYVYATPTGGAPMLIGRTTADANGAWSVTSTSALADGGYVIQAQAYDATGHTVSALTTVTPSLVIDTVGPKITDLVFDNLGGQVIATFQDFGGVNGAGVGLNFATIVDANNYRFALIKSAVRGYKPPVQWIVGGIAVQPGTTVGPQTAAIKINDGRGIRGGRYLFTVRSVDPANLTGVQDLAGNALDGEFYSFFPSGNNHVGGDFVAELDAVHHRIYAPKTTVGTASPVTPPGVRGVDRFIARNPKPLPTAAAAVRLSTARLTAARTSTLAPRALLRVR
ncbi:beta strand repeat-containing protein [Paludisphaera borealis]|nr:Ig-like domain-containing protein [Paludisphaera borealis]